MGANDKHSPKKSKIPSDAHNPPFYLPLKSLSRYKIVSNLGNGSFGSVQLAKSAVDLYDASNFNAFNNTLMQRTGKFNNENIFNKRVGLVAIKTMTKKLNLINDYAKIKEIRFILSMPYHPNLVQMYEMFIDNKEYKLHIVMECMDQNLYQLMKARRYNRFSKTTLKSILSQILNGIRHIHRCEYFHRDIKPENILVSPSNRFYDQDYINSPDFKYHDSFVVKIADYGLARHIDNKRPYTSYVSTRWYRSPEILLRKNWYSKPVDIWAFGSVACEATTFRPLFPGSDELDQIWKVFTILGTPNSKHTVENYYPSYGYWDEAQSLSSQLKIEFPRFQESIDISCMIPDPELEPLCEVIRACLTWNPNTRATVDDLCAMSYFKGTCVDDSPTLPLPIPVPAHFKSIKNSVLNDGIDNSFVSKAGILAGIPNFQNDGSIEIDRDIDVGINKENYQFDHASFAAKSSNECILSDPFTLDLDKQDNGVRLSNDENQNAFGNNKHKVNVNNQNFTNTSYNAAKPRTTLKPSTDDYLLLNYEGSDKYPFSPNIEPNYVYNTNNQHIHHQHKQQQNPNQHEKQWGQQISFNYTNGEIFNDSNDLVNLKPNTIDDKQLLHDSPNLNHSQYGIDGSSLNIDEILNSPMDELEDKLLFQQQGSTTHGSLHGLYPNNEVQHNQPDGNTNFDNNSRQSLVPLFTGELLSKYSLRRTNDQVATDSSFPDIQDPYDVYQ